MLRLGKKIIGGKGQLMITTRRRLLILSPRNLLIRVGAITLAVVTLTYSTCLGLKVRQSEAAAAKIGAVTNTYMGKNSAQAEKCRQIRLFANTIINKSYSNSESAIAEHGAFKVLRRPYPSVREAERRLGAADERVVNGQAAHLIWNQITWEKPHPWPGGDMDRAWPLMKNKVVEAWFDSSGMLSKLIIFQQNEGDSGKVVECIGRQPEDWKIGDSTLFSPLE